MIKQQYILRATPQQRKDMDRAAKRAGGYTPLAHILGSLILRGRGRPALLLIASYQRLSIEEGQPPMPKTDTPHRVTVHLRVDADAHLAAQAAAKKAGISLNEAYLQALDAWTRANADVDRAMAEVTKDRYLRLLADIGLDTPPLAE